MAHALATAQAGQDRRFLVLPIGGQKKRNRLSDNLARGIAEQPLSC
jgi:hypothetical protein